MPDPLTAAAAISAAAVYIAKASYEFVVKSKSGNGSGNGNGNGNHCKAQDVQSAMQNSLDKQTELLQDTRDGVNKLVTLAERDRRYEHSR